MNVSIFGDIDSYLVNVTDKEYINVEYGTDDYRDDIIVTLETQRGIESVTLIDNSMKTNIQYYSSMTRGIIVLLDKHWYNYVYDCIHSYSHLPVVCVGTEEAISKVKSEYPNAKIVYSTDMNPTNNILELMKKHYRDDSLELIDEYMEAYEHYKEDDVVDLEYGYDSNELVKFNFLANTFAPLRAKL